MIYLIAIVSLNNGIGKNNKLPWNIKEDMEYFKKITTGTGNNAIIMGKNTWISLKNPLKNRRNIVISKTLKDENCSVFSSLNEGITYAKSIGIFDIFIIGGSSLFKEAMEHKLCDFLCITKINKIYECDTFFPVIPECYECIKSEKYDVFDNNDKLSITRCYYSEKNEEEYQYLNLIKEVLATDRLRPNRTGIDTLSVFGKSMRYSLLNNKFPLFTTKKVFFRAVVEELLWFLSGSTNSNILSNKKIYIWNDNTSREYLDNNGFKTREVGDIGPGYGFQWRHFGENYKNMHTEYKGFDQIKEIINLLKTDPMSRRIILTAWNPTQIKEMSLPPCHCLAQFYVHYENDEKYLSCQMYQRSGDIGLGIPFNVASYSLLTIMIAQCTGMKPYEFIHVIGDGHIYKNHIEQLKIQIERHPFKFPTIKLNENIQDIFGFNYDDFKLDNYLYHDPIKMDMVA